MVAVVPGEAGYFGGVAEVDREFFEVVFEEEPHSGSKAAWTSGGNGSLA